MSERKSLPQYLALVPSSVMIGVFFLIPFALILLASVAVKSPDGDFSYGFDLEHFQRFFTWFYIERALFSAGICALIAFLSLLIAFPFTYMLTGFSERGKTLWLIYILAQLSLSEVLIAFSWQVLLSRTAGLGNILAYLGVVEKSFAMAPSAGAVIAALVYLAVPFAILLLYPALSRMDKSLVEAARTLGSSTLGAFFRIVLPSNRAALVSSSVTIFVIAAVSFNAKKFLAFPPKGFSFRWYAEIFIDNAWFSSLLNLLLIAVSSAVLAVLIALPVAYVLWKSGLRYAKVLYSLGVAPFILPPVIMALAFMLLFSVFGMNGFMINVVIAHAIFLLALPLLTISLGLESVDESILEAAQTMGADSKTVFRTVVFPIAAPFAFAGFAFCFVLSLNEYIIALMTVGFTVETLPIKIFNALRYGYTPVIASIAVVFLLINVLVFSLIAKFSNLSRILGAMD